MCYSHSSHEEVLEQFTDAPYKAGTFIMVIYHTKDYQSSLLTLHIGWYMHYSRSSLKELPESFTDAPCSSDVFH